MQTQLSLDTLRSLDPHGRIDQAIRDAVHDVEERGRDDQKARTVTLKIAMQFDKKGGLGLSLDIAGKRPAYVVEAPARIEWKDGEQRLLFDDRSCGEPAEPEDAPPSEVTFRAADFPAIAKIGEQLQEAAS